MTVDALRVTFASVFFAVTSVDLDSYFVDDLDQRHSRLFCQIANAKVAQSTLHKVTAADFLDHSIAARTKHRLEKVKLVKYLSELLSF